MTLEQWFCRALDTGVVYYTAKLSRSNMSALYSLYIVDTDGVLERGWPSEAHPQGGWDYSDKLAKALGFRQSKRAWYCGGCGYNRVHDILYRMAVHFGRDLKSINHLRFEGLDVE